jgi:hypothetical protein
MAMSFPSLIMMLGYIMLASLQVQSVAASLASQVHLSLGAALNTFVVTWSTPSDDACSLVAVDFEPPPMSLERMLFVEPPPTTYFEGDAERFVDNGTLHHTQYIHRVLLKGLAHDSAFTYRVANRTSSSTSTSRGRAPAIDTGDANRMTAPTTTTTTPAGCDDVAAVMYGRPFSLRTFPNGGGSDWHNPSFTVYGDFGLANATSLPALKREAAERRTDMILHNGDFVGHVSALVTFIDVLLCVTQCAL